VERAAQHFFVTSVIFNEAAAQRKQLPNGRKFGQSGHPVLDPFHSYNPALKTTLSDNSGKQSESPPETELLFSCHRDTKKSMINDGCSRVQKSVETAETFFCCLKSRHPELLCQVVLKAATIGQFLPPGLGRNLEPSRNLLWRHLQQSVIFYAGSKNSFKTALGIWFSIIVGKYRVLQQHLCTTCILQRMYIRHARMDASELQVLFLRVARWFVF
jgi:hypothetical protein